MSEPRATASPRTASAMRVWPGKPSPLGATWTGEGVNFALFSDHATSVELCLFDSPDAATESSRLALPERTNQVWHGFLPGARPGQVYGYRVHGGYDLSRGLRFDPSKVLFDPYARAVARDIRWQSLGRVLERGADTAACAPLAAVGVPGFDWGDDRQPLTPWHESVVYELHVKGFTRLHPGVPQGLRGTYAGLASDAALAHLLDLGVTAVELLPVHYHIDEVALVRRGLTNYWGYNTLGFFAPDPRFSASGPAGAVDEFKSMVKALHAAGIEVVLDVVYNHTAEGDELGPTLAFRGIDNPSYYRLEDDPARYVDFTGCGNTLKVFHPRTLQLVMDSLRYWVEEMHVDGFRFDLASTLGRDRRELDRMGAVFDIIHQDPVLSEVKLIAEPWDLGPNGFQAGNFPVLWTEWNAHYRDCVRKFWRGAGGTVSELATRLAGSSDLYSHNGRHPTASLNFVTAHDGFTLRDLVSYDRKHNDANGDGNRDGTDNNESWNCGAEGPTDDPEVIALRARQQRNFLATLLLSQGVPMVLAGDEFGQTQSGNNNAYCQDNPLSWLDWSLAQASQQLVEFVRMVVKLRRTEPVFQRRLFFQGRPIHGSEVKDIYWIRPDGAEMTDADWDVHHCSCLGMFLPGDRIDEPDARGRRITGDSFAVFFNAHETATTFVLGARRRDLRWSLVLDTANPGAAPQYFEHLDPLTLGARSLVVLRAHPAGPG